MAQGFLTGLMGSQPLFSAEQARRRARRRMPRIFFDNVDGAAGNEAANHLNQAELAQIRLQPRVLLNVAERRVAKTFMGREWGLPFGIAPMGMCNTTWPGADRMLARQAVKSDIPVGLSTAASSSLEDMQAWSDGRAWFQLYVGQSHEVAFDLVARAERAGYETLILTVDVPEIAARRRDLENGLKVPFYMGPRQFLDFACHPRWSIETLIQGKPALANFPSDGPGAFRREESRAGTDWAFLKQLRERWPKTLIVKGVMSVEDAIGIKAAGVDAIYVSNHGGRQLESAPAAIRLLPLIRAALGADYPLIFDSGVRGGEDVLKALALGADYVMLGRALLFAIGADGARGLAGLVDALAAELSVAMAQLGLCDLEGVDGGILFSG